MQAVIFQDNIETAVAVEPRHAHQMHGGILNSHQQSYFRSVGRSEEMTMQRDMLAKTAMRFMVIYVLNVGI